MLVLLVYVAYPGFSCVPPVTLNASVRSPYEGPFVMSLETAQQIMGNNTTNIQLEIIRGDDPRFEDIKSRCPPIFFPARDPQ